MTLDPGLMACGLMVHALRGDTDSAQLLLQALDDTEIRPIVLRALEGLATAVRSAGGTHLAEQIADGIQHGLYDTERNTP